MRKKVLDRFLFVDGLSREQLEVLFPLFQEIRYQKDQTIFEQGEDAHYLYFVVEGKVAIRFNPEDGPVLTVSEVEAGDVFGWSSALGSRLYTSSAVCTDPGLFLRMEGSDLKKLCQEEPETGILLLNRLAGVIAQRLRGTHNQVVAMLHEGLQNGQKGGQET